MDRTTVRYASECRYGLSEPNACRIKEQVSLKQFRCVVTIFSIFEEALASCRAKVSMRMPWFGMVAARPLSSARARFARASAFRTATVSNSTGDGSTGIVWVGVNMTRTKC